ncbi:MAG: glutamate--tRNA ligase [Candidatus Micrarchaeia archaeon]
MDIEESCRKHALKNAADYGKADARFVIGKVLGEHPDAKADYKKTSALVDAVVNAVNALPAAEVARELEGFVFEKKTQREGLPPSPISPAITRIAPNPSGMLHIGHARAIVLNDEYARTTNGKFFVRLEDTDPKTKKPLPEAYERIPRDIKWLGCNIAEIVVQSDRLETYYEYARRLLEEGNAFVCDCPIEEMHSLKEQGKACPCRARPPAEQLARWERMFDGYPEGGAVMRVKTDYAHENASIRDWPAFRIVTGEHPRKPGARVWPLYNFACPIDDHLFGINLVIRGKEHELNAVKQAFVYDYLNWPQPTFLEYGLVKVPGLLSHKSEILEGIRSGEYSGWDDVRLPTLAALRRRGIQPQAIRNYMLSLGVKRVDSQLDWNKLYHANKDLIDASTQRRFFVEDPVCVKLAFDAPASVELSNHPSGALGKRSVAVASEVFVSRRDFDAFHGKTVRLKDLANVVLSENCESAGNEIVQSMPKLQWVSHGTPVRILKPDGTIASGLVEPSCSALKIGEVVQFERVGYCRLDSPGEYWFGHE